ncbi:MULTISPECIES: hypothetical protein [unclassified Mesorhizobium]|uniref:hypothetical protein n=1 Tax=unclassified Mesorhizobium TaxID=325217 RepID=UPI00115D97F1|nr:MULTISPECIES: hypothetical protein [unclassified Mesorhizobium]TRC91753.1 hypothetical protein FJV80_02035 [Mesorhizobium sp. WSM4310]TRD05557.1 hypothetical protein FJV82_10220 [Mesorhizobium sp. WSM4305]
MGSMPVNQKCCGIADLPPLVQMQAGSGAEDRIGPETEPIYTYSNEIDAGNEQPADEMQMAA